MKQSLPEKTTIEQFFVKLQLHLPLCSMIKEHLQSISLMCSVSW